MKAYTIILVVGLALLLIFGSLWFMARDTVEAPMVSPETATTTS